LPARYSLKNQFSVQYKIMIKNKNDQFSNGNKSVEAPLNV